MTQLRPTRLILLVVLLLCGAVVSPARAENQPAPLTEWARGVWKSANDGDLGALERHLKTFPEEPGTASALQFKQTLARHNENYESAMAHRDEARADALARMGEQLEANEVSQALTAAVEVQTLTDDRQGILEDPKLTEVVTRARAQVPVSRREGDWLYAYELLYRLNVLYEHTGEHEQELDRVNQRLSLLTHYAPRRLHELRQRQAERFDDEPLGDFNASLTEGGLEGAGRGNQSPHGQAGAGDGGRASH
jgi:hypothetical protein